MVVAAFFIYKPQQGFDKKVTLAKKDTRPYATSLCYQSITSMFKNSVIKSNTSAPYDWYEYDSVKNGGHLFFLVSQRFNPTSDDLGLLKSFIENGNYVFICTSNMNADALEYFKLDLQYTFNTIDIEDSYYDSVSTYLNTPYYSKDYSFFNAGFTSGMDFKNIDSVKYNILGTNHQQTANFIKGTVGNGMIFFHSDPFLFCNYFLTQQNNTAYLQKVLSAIPNNVHKVIWDDYYTYKKNNETKKDNSPFRVLFKYPSFMWAFGLAISLFLVYFIIHFKRQQKFVIEKKYLTNDSLYFAETIGRLYFEKGDHLNLAKKMASYFLEHIRSKYFINTSVLNGELIGKLSTKSGYKEEGCEKIIQTIVNIQALAEMSQIQLNECYLLFQDFYKKTT